MKPARSRTRRALWWSLGAAAVLLLLIAAVAWRMVRSRPAWWNPAEAQSTDNIVRGEYFENQVVTAFHKVRPPEAARWTLELDDQWINAWLATRLPLWAANRGLSWSATVDEANVDIGDGRIRFGLSYGPAGAGQPYSIEFRPRLDENGRLRIEDLRLRAGRLRLPLGFAGEALFSAAGSLPEARAAIAGQPIDPVLRLSDGRRVVLRDLTFEGERLILTLETLAER
ncbi:MAG: hypothetical protein KJZ69_14580 [Phycisphaerales bacterium]|nr:hypothetical protein [Phycisphaerales bacterium]